MHHDLVSTSSLQPLVRVITPQPMTPQEDNPQELTFMPAQQTWLAPKELEETKECTRYSFDDKDEVEYLNDEDEDPEDDDSEDDDDDSEDDDDDDFDEDDDFDLEI